jgi:hypothetical protein
MQSSPWRKRCGGVGAGAGAGAGEGKKMMMMMDCSGGEHVRAMSERDNGGWELYGELTALSQVSIVFPSLTYVIAGRKNSAESLCLL